MKIECRTLFDCSATGVTGHFRKSELPYQDRLGQLISDQGTWNRSRNQQRNWETLLQIVQLRSQIEILTEPQQHEDGWIWQFQVESEFVYGENFSGLTQDAEGVPMLRGLDEKTELADCIKTSGRKQNIWFRQINN